jgi:hypothetical protein
MDNNALDLTGASLSDAMFFRGLGVKQSRNASGTALYNILRIGFPFREGKRISFHIWENDSPRKRQQRYYNKRRSKNGGIVTEPQLKPNASPNQLRNYVQDFGFAGIMRDWDRRDYGWLRAVDSGFSVYKGLKHMLSRPFGEEFYEWFWGWDSSTFAHPTGKKMDVPEPYKLNDGIRKGRVIDLNHFAILCAYSRHNIDVAEAGMRALMYGNCHICAQIEKGGVLGPGGCIWKDDHPITTLFKRAIWNPLDQPSVAAYRLSTLWSVNHDDHVECEGYSPHPRLVSEHSHINSIAETRSNKIKFGTKIIYHSNLMARFLVRCVSNYHTHIRSWIGRMPLSQAKTIVFSSDEIEEIKVQMKMLPPEFERTVRILAASYFASACTHIVMPIHSTLEPNFAEIWRALCNNWHMLFRSGLMWIAFVFMLPVVTPDATYQDTTVVSVNSTIVHAVEESVLSFLRTGTVCYDEYVNGAFAVALQNVLDNHEILLPGLFVKRGRQLTFNDLSSIVLEEIPGWYKLASLQSGRVIVFENDCKDWANSFTTRD